MDGERRRSGGAGMAGVVLATFLVAGCKSGPPPEQIAAGRELYLASCAVCHGQDARGVQMRGKNLHGNEFVRGLSDAELVAFLEQGRAAAHPANERGIDMPPRGGNPSLSDEELGLIGDYLRSIQSAE